MLISFSTDYFLPVFVRKERSLRSRTIVLEIEGLGLGFVS